MKFSKGDILVPRDGHFPESAVVVVGYDDMGRLLAHPLGGGFECAYSAGEERFRVVGEGERSSALFRQGKFSLMDADDRFTGWTDGQTWNGWAKPHFEFAEAERLIAWLKDGLGRFDRDGDEFVTASPDGEEEVWPAESIAIADASRMKVYAIGAGCWCWDEVAGKEGV